MIFFNKLYKLFFEYQMVFTMSQLSLDVYNQDIQLLIVVRL